mgnify:CR=1 FL=1
MLHPGNDEAARDACIAAGHDPVHLKYVAYERHQASGSWLIFVKIGSKMLNFFASGGDDHTTRAEAQTSVCTQPGPPDYGPTPCTPRTMVQLHVSTATGIPRARGT